MYLEQVQGPATRQGLNISAKLITSIKILQCSAEELEQYVAQELTENPALELEESSHCLRCGTALHVGLCPVCDAQPDTDGHDPREDVAGWDDEPQNYTHGLASLDDSEYDPLEFVRSTATLHDHLMRQLGAVLDDDDLGIAEYLVGNLNSHGYLTVSLEEAATTLRVASERITSVLDVLQSLDPPGIGARDLRECLMIQLRMFEEQGAAHPLARVLVDRYITELGEHHFAEIAREIGATATQVKDAWHFIRANLNPFPAHAFESGDLPDLGLSLNGDRSATIRPDVIIRRTDRGFEAEVVESRRYRFNLNATYGSLYRECRVNAASPSGLSESERQHIRQYAARARFFMDCIRQRWTTLSLIANALIEQQHDFLEHGVRFLQPLTRGELASHVGLHESTVSRATAGKYVLLPNGRTVSFDDFFDGSLAAKDLLRELIAGENPSKPYSDEELAVLLHERGLVLARRTVAKYREAIGILPSRLRI